MEHEEKIRQLADTLKNSGLAASYEDAYERARSILAPKQESAPKAAEPAEKKDSHPEDKTLLEIMQQDAEQVYSEQSKETTAELSKGQEPDEEAPEAPVGPDPEPGTPPALDESPESIDTGKAEPQESPETDDEFIVRTEEELEELGQSSQEKEDIAESSEKGNPEP